MPIMIGETGSVEHGGSKAEWIQDALTVQLPASFPRIKALIWFDMSDGSINLELDTSPASLAALQRAIALPAYQANSYAGLNQSPIPPPEQVVLPPQPPPSRDSWDNGKRSAGRRARFGWAVAGHH